VPTVLTHAMVGASLGAASRAPVSRLWLVLLLAVLAMLPDADVLAFWLGIPYAAPLGHRGFSHSLAFAALAGPLALSAAFPALPRFSGFVQGGASVLASEARWLWAPLALVWAIALAGRRIARPRGA